MKIRKVRYFLALCEEQSFTRAARRCGVAQPSLTRAIQLLEEEIGGRLFERGNSNVRLTELGMLVRSDFVTISAAAENIRRNAAHLSAPSMTNPDDQPKEGYMRTLAIAVATVSILAIGVALHPTPVATAFEPAQLNTGVDTYGLQSGIYARSLPAQQIQDLF